MKKNRTIILILVLVLVNAGCIAGTGNINQGNGEKNQDETNASNLYENLYNVNQSGELRAGRIENISEDATIINSSNQHLELNVIQEALGKAANDRWINRTYGPTVAIELNASQHRKVAKALSKLPTALEYPSGYQTNGNTSVNLLIPFYVEYEDEVVGIGLGPINQSAQSLPRYRRVSG